MTRISQTMAVGMALLLALSVLAPTVAAAQETTTVSVETDAATDVTDTSATLNGNLAELSGAESATVYFEYWVEGDRENSQTTSEMTVEEAGAFDASVSGLTNDETYEYVAHVSAGDTTDEGETQTFTTLVESPLGVDTLAASDVTDTSATLNGELTGLGGAESATVYFEYWAEGDSENPKTTTEMNVGAGEFSLPVSDLSKDTTYVYVAHAETDDATVEGETQTFTTLSEPPLGVDTLAASDVSPSSATLNGELTGLGGAESATVYFEYWVEGDSENSKTTSEMEMTEGGEFDANVSGLSYNETYVYVAHAESGDTTVSGTQTTFTPDVPEDGGDQPFGYWVSAFVHSLMDSDDSDERNLGQIVSAFVTENNPGADNRPDHAGPPGEDDGDAESEDDDRHGPPDHAGKDKDSRGPPDHASKDKGSDSDDSDDSDDSEA